MKKKESGITLVALIITIILALILAAVGTYSALETYNFSKQTKFIAYMQLIQKEVDEVLQSGKDFSQIGEEISEEDLSSIQIIIDNAYKNGEIGSNEISDSMRFFTKDAIQQEFNIEEVYDEVIVNFATREVVSMYGIEYEGVTYYTQYKLPNAQTVIEFNAESIDRNISFDLEKNTDTSEIIISNISIPNGSIFYKINDSEWTILTNYTEIGVPVYLKANFSGTYTIKVQDNVDKDNVYEKSIYIPRTLIEMFYSGDLKVGDYVDYIPDTVGAYDPDKGEGGGTYTGVTDAAVTANTSLVKNQSLAQETLNWRVLGCDGKNVYIVSETPTQAKLSIYGAVGYNNYEDVLNDTCKALYSKVEIGTARSIKMSDIDNYLGGSAYDKTTYVNDTTRWHGYSREFTNIFHADQWSSGATWSGTLTNNEYYYSAADVITDETKLELLIGEEGTFGYWVAYHVLAVGADWAGWCSCHVGGGQVCAGYGLCTSAGTEDGQPMRLRPVVCLESYVTEEQVPII